MKFIIRLLSIQYVFLILIPIFVFGQSTRDFKAEYLGLTSNITSEESYHVIIKDYFNSLTVDELVLALSEISDLGDENFIAFDLLQSVYSKFEDENFLNLMINEINKETNSDKYKTVLIDFVTTKSRNDQLYTKKMDDLFYNIAKNKNFSSRLRFIAASHVGSTSDHDHDKTVLKELIQSDDLAVINGSSKAIKRLIRTEPFKDEIDEWVDELIKMLENNQHRIDQLATPIKVLGYAKTHNAKEYLLALFKTKAKVDKKITEEIVAGLSNLADIDVFTEVFSEYSKYGHFQDYDSELILKSLISNNQSVISELYLIEDEQYSIVFLKSVRLLKKDEKNEYLERVKTLSKSLNEEIRLEAVKTIHFLLPHNKEIEFFRELLKNEKSEKIRTEVFTYIGRE